MPSTTAALSASIAYSFFSCTRTFGVTSGCAIIRSIIFSSSASATETASMSVAWR
jgi:hypothetical protein